MHPTELAHHEAQLTALGADLRALGLPAEVELHCGRHGRWLVTPGEGARIIPPHRRWRQTRMPMVRVGMDVIHLTTDDLASVMIVAADLAVRGRWTADSDAGAEYCPTVARPVLLRHPSEPALWWFSGSGELAPLGDVQAFMGVRHDVRQPQASATVTKDHPAGGATRSV